MTFNDYYKVVKYAALAKTRLDCLKSTRSYDPFEEKRMTKEQKPTESKDGIRVGSLLFYVTNPDSHIKSRKERQPWKSLTCKQNNVSGIFLPYRKVDNSPIKDAVGYGDVSGTMDAIIFVIQDFSEDSEGICYGTSIELFIARGRKNSVSLLMDRVVDGTLDDEMEFLRNSAIRELGEEE